MLGVAIYDEGVGVAGNVRGRWLGSFCAVLVASGVLAGAATAAPPLELRPGDRQSVRLGELRGDDPPSGRDIGPRRSGTPQEREAAEYLKSVLDVLGFQTQIYSFPINGNRAVAQISSPNATLPNGPNWQFSSSTSGVQTGAANPVTGEVVYAGTGATAASFPANSAGKIVLMDQAATHGRPHDAGQQRDQRGRDRGHPRHDDDQQRRHPCRSAGGDALGPGDRAGDGRGPLAPGLDEGSCWPRARCGSRSPPPTTSTRCARSWSAAASPSATRPARRPRS